MQSIKLRREKTCFFSPHFNALHVSGEAGKGPFGLGFGCPFLSKLGRVFLNTFVLALFFCSGVGSPLDFDGDVVDG